MGLSGGFKVLGFGAFTPEAPQPYPFFKVLEVSVFEVGLSFWEVHSLDYRGQLPQYPRDSQDIVRHWGLGSGANKSRERAMLACSGEPISPTLEALVLQ